jgi:hypothetical protein
MTGWPMRVVLVILQMLVAAPALADTPFRVVLLSDPQAEITRRLHAESAEVGLELIAGGTPRDDDVPVKLAERHRAMGVIRVSSSTLVELWFVARAGGAASYAAIRADGGDDGSFALRVAEEVRARAIELRMLPGDAPPHSPSTGGMGDSGGTGRATERNVSFMQASGGVGAISARGGMGATVFGVLAARARLASRWSATAQALLPLTSNPVAGPEGSATVHAYLFTGQVNHLVWRSESRWSATMGAGAGALLLALHADGAAGYVGRSDRVTAAVGFLNAELAAHLTDAFVLRVSLLAGASAPRPVARFDGNEVAAWGRPFAGGVVALDWAVPIGKSGVDR